MIRRNYFIFLLSSLFVFLTEKVQAFCPVCTVAVAGGVGLSRYLGVDDTIAGVWIGGMTAAIIVWTLDWFKKKNIRFFAQKTITIGTYCALVIFPLWSGNIIGHPLNKIWGVDKLMLGIILGSTTFYFGGMFHFKMKEKNGDKVYFPFQKVVFSILPLLILSAIFYFITK